MERRFFLCGVGGGLREKALFSYAFRVFVVLMFTPKIPPIMAVKNITNMINDLIDRE